MRFCSIRGQFVFWAFISLAGCAPAPDPIVLQEGQIYVYRGENIYSLAHRYAVSPQALIHANNLKAPYIVYEGQILLLPRKAAPVVPESTLDLGKEGGGPVLMQDSQWEDLPPVDPSVLDTKKETVQAAPKNSADEVCPPFGTQEKVDPRLLEEIDEPEKKTRESKKEVEKEEGKSVKESSKKASSKSKKEINRIQFCSPVKGAINHSEKKQGFAYFDVEKGSTVVACADGEVLHAGTSEVLSGKQSSFVVVAHENGFLTVYFAVDQLKVKAKQKVRAGECLGVSQGSSFKLQMRHNRKPVDPKLYLK